MTTSRKPCVAEQKMSVEFRPRPYQQQIIDYILANDRCAIWAGMGLGKTVSTLTAIKQILDNSLLIPLKCVEAEILL